MVRVTCCRLKFLVIWRVARGWALCDDVEPPENMNRCVINNYTSEGFWRSWHRGFNIWNVRYLFVPLGGRKYKALNIWVIFTWVAMWHDFKPQLIVWAWGVCVLMICEVLVKGAFNKPKVRDCDMV
jgi:D-alanyl-lipoteichoic acid acyltransferase DltB (MBOAT superfamily)